MAPLLLVTGGGTGGHVSPGLGVAREWQARHGAGSVAWVGRRGGIEEAMALREGLAFHAVEAAALKRGLVPGNLALPLVLLKGLRQARRLVKDLDPAAVLMTGGYVGLPLSLAAALAGKPLVLLEVNAVPGLANRLLRPLAKRFCAAYAPASTHPKVVVTGTPCRLKDLPSMQEARQALGLDQGKRTLLVMPGSQAARAVNAALREALPLLKDRAMDWQALWMCGPVQGEREACLAAAAASGLSARVEGFITDVASAYAAADLVLCRSGASTLAELALAGKPSLQVPYPHATGDHQRANAGAFARAGAARVLFEDGLDGASLSGALRFLMDGPKVLEAMARAAASLGRADAAARVAEEIEKALL